MGFQSKHAGMVIYVSYNSDLWSAAAIPGVPTNG